MAHARTTRPKATPDWANHPSCADLAAVPLMESLPRKQLEAVAPLFTIRTYPRNAIVATEDDRPEHFCLILSGSVQAFWRDDAGHQLMPGIDGPGDHYPDVSLGGETSLVSRIALSDMRVAMIAMGEMRRLLKRHPRMTYTLLMDVVRHACAASCSDRGTSRWKTCTAAS